MPRAVFAMRVAEVIAALRAEPDLPYATRRAVWLKLFELNDVFNRQAPHKEPSPQRGEGGGEASG